MLNCNINFSGLQISRQDQSEIEGIMRLIHSRSPSDSFLTLCIIIGENDVNGFLSIDSNKMKHKINLVGKNPLNVMKNMVVDFNSQLNVWKKCRIV